MRYTAGDLFMRKDEKVSYLVYLASGWIPFLPLHMHYYIQGDTTEH